MFFPFFIDLQDSPTVIEIFEAVGVVGTLTAVIISLIKLFRRDRDRQKQIDSLAAIAAESKNQTEIFLGQLKILSEYIALYSKDVANSERVAELSKKMRNSSIRPNFDRLPQKIGKLSMVREFVNRGGLAKIIKIVAGPKNEVHVPAIDTYKEKTIKNGETWSITFTTNDNCHDKIKSCFVDLKILLEDEDHNKYEFNINGKANNLNYSELIDISSEEPKES